MLAAIAFFLSLRLVMPPDAHAVLRVVATTPDLAALVAEVGGEQVSVQAMSVRDQDPHYVDPRPSLVVKLSRADLLVVNGLGLEIGWLPPLMVNARNADIQLGAPGYFDASEHVRLMEVSRTVDRTRGDVHPGGNPHFLFDPRAASMVSRAIGERLAMLAPEQAHTFRGNARRVSEELLVLAKAETKRFSALGAKRLKVVTYHRSLVYLLDWLGIERPINVEPIPVVAPSPGHVSRVLSTMRAQKIGTILQERFYPTRTSQTLARMATAQLVILSGGTHFEKGERYVTRMKKMAEEIYASLSR